MALYLDQDYYPTNQKDALSMGLPFYFSGKECKYGHKTSRYTSTNICFFCNQNRVKKYIKQYDASEQRNEKSRLSYAKNKEFRLNQIKGYSQLNREKLRSKYAKHRYKKMQRTPLWADEEKIKEIYAKCPKGFHVDHIIPLNGKLVSGLHTVENLQYLPAIENMQKSNRYLGE